MQKKSTHTKKGFTLIETLVSILILLIAITGPLTVAQSGLQASFVARDQIVAFYLAQDVIEVIKNLRDNRTLLSGTGGWTGIVGSFCVPNDRVFKACTVDTSKDTINFAQCLSGACPALNFDQTERKFTYDPTSNSNVTESKYTRTVYLYEVNKDEELQIIVKVTWDSNFFSTREVIVQENIFNWGRDFTNNP